MKRSVVEAAEEREEREDQQLRLHGTSRKVTMISQFEERSRRRRMSRRSARTWCFLSLSFLSIWSFVAWETRHHERLRESRSTLFRQLRRVNVRDNDRNYLAFGASWGAHATPYAYPSLLSKSAHLVSFAQSSEPVAASVCTQSIVGDDLYDAILLEFQEWTVSHQILAERLRLRFPAATLIFVRVWNPTHIVYQNSDGSTVDLVAWMENSTLHSNELGLKVLESGPERWSIRLPRDTQEVKDVAARLKATLYTLARPSSKDFNFPLNLNAYLSFFDPVTFQLTQRGNSVLEAGLQSILKKVPFPTNPRLGTWGMGDDCHVWYSTGQYPEATTARRLEIASASEIHKHALEVRPSDVLQVQNSFKESRMLFLTYMTSCDEHDDRVYPRVRVAINGRAMVVLDPYHDDCSKTHHLTRTSPVGLIPPGTNTVGFYPLDLATSLKFRLVGTSLLYEAAAGNVDLALEPEPSLATESWGIW